MRHRSGDLHETSDFGHHGLPRNFPLHSREGSFGQRTCSLHSEHPSQGSSAVTDVKPAPRSNSVPDSSRSCRRGSSSSVPDIHAVQLCGFRARRLVHFHERSILGSSGLLDLLLPPLSSRPPHRCTFLTRLFLPPSSAKCNSPTVHTSMFSKPLAFSCCFSLGLRGCCCRCCCCCQHLDHGLTHGGYHSFEDLLQMFDSDHGRC